MSEILWFVIGFTVTLAIISITDAAIARARAVK